MKLLKEMEIIPDRNNGILLKYKSWWGGNPGRNYWGTEQEIIYMFDKDEFCGVPITNVVDRESFIIILNKYLETKN